MKMTSLMIALCVVLASGGNFAKAEDRVLIRAQAVHTADGNVLRPGQVLVVDGKIQEVGGSISADNVQVLEVQHLLPGLIDAAARTGIDALDRERTREITPELSTASIIDWNDREFTEQLQGGTTTLHLMPGTDNVVAGLASVAKTAGDQSERMLVERTGLAISMCSDPASGNRSRSRPDSIYIRQPTNRMGVVWMLRATFHASQTKKNSSPVINEALAGKLPVFGVSRTQYDIQTLMTLADEFSFQPIVVGGQESWQVMEELAARKIPVILQPETPGSSTGTERTRISVNMAARLHEAGVPFCLSGGNLLNQLRFAVRFGLPQESAVQSITANPAKILKIDKQVGSIAVGKHADFVAMDGDPLEFTTAISWVMVNGKIQFERADD